MHDVYINGFGAFFPGPPVGNDAMETYLGRIGGKPSRYRPVVLRNNGITTRHYALDENGVARHSNASMAAAAIRAAADSSELLLGDLSYLATATTLGDVLLPGLASQVHAELGIGPIEIASFQSVCASSLMALKAASAQIALGEHRAAAVSGSEFASRYSGPVSTSTPATVRAPALRSKPSSCGSRSRTARAPSCWSPRRTRGIAR